MLELTWTRTKYFYKLTNSIRQSSSKATMKIRLMKENKEIFGPVIKSKQKKGKKKDEPVENKFESQDSGELSWSIATTNINNLMIVKKTGEIDNFSKKNSVYKFLKLQNESVDKTTRKILQIKSSKTKKHSNNQDSEVVKKFDCNFEKKKEEILFGNKNPNDNAVGLLTEEKNKKSDEGVKKVGDLLGLKSNEILNFSIFGNTKDDSDNWHGNNILKFSPKSQYDYSLPGVTRVLNETMSEQAKLMLEKWKEKMIKELGEDGFNSYHQAQLQDSKIMHSLIEKTLRKEPVDVPSHIKPSYESINLILKDVNNVRFIESQIVHPVLGYRGFVDCIATYGGKVCLIDWKKSEKVKTLNTTYDSPLQISAYIGALNADSNYPFQVKTGLLAIAYSNGNPPSVFEFSTSKLEFYWKEWLKRLDKYHTMHSNY